MIKKIFKRKTVCEFQEFTWDMVRGLPTAYYYHKQGYNVKAKVKKGLGELYYFADRVVEVEKFNDVNDMSNYSHDKPAFARSKWLPPPLNDYYSGGLQFEKPTLVIQNKYSKEWHKDPVNYFSLELLEKLIGLFQEKYQILYIRPTENFENYFIDDNEILSFGDYELLNQKYPQVVHMGHLKKKNPDMGYNTLQFMAEATSAKHLAVAGGNACVAAYFKGDVVIYNVPNAPYGNPDRGIWKSGSWLKHLSGASIYGAENYSTLLNLVEELWL